MNSGFEKIDSDSLLNMPFLDFEEFQKIPFYVWNYDLTKHGWDWRLPKASINKLRIGRFAYVPMLLFVALFGIGAGASLVFVLIQRAREGMFEASNFLWQYVSFFFLWFLIAVGALWVLFRSAKTLLEPLVCSISMKSEPDQIKFEGLKHFLSLRLQPLVSISIQDILKVNLQKNLAVSKQFSLWLELKNGKRFYLSVHDMQKDEASFLKMMLERDLRMNESTI